MVSILAFCAGEGLSGTGLPALWAVLLLGGSWFLISRRAYTPLAGYVAVFAALAVVAVTV